MILFCARDNILTDHKFFKKEPKQRIKYNSIAGQVDIRFSRTDETPIPIWNFHELFPKFEVAIGTCSVFDITENENGYAITLIEKNKKLETII
jgi:hypothetical protein